MFLDAFYFIVDQFVSLIGWFFGYSIQSGITFGGIIIIILVLTALFRTVVGLFEVSGYVGPVMDRAKPGVVKVRRGMKNMQKKAEKWK
jgi:hypothetical protein